MTRHWTFGTIAVVGLVAVLAGGGLAYASAGRTGSTHAAAPPTHHTLSLRDKHAHWPPPTVAKWWVLEANPGARSVVISVQQPITTAGCPAGASTTATETASTIRLHVTVKYQKAPVCLAIDRRAEVRVPLDRRVDGRKIEGAGLI